MHLSRAFTLVELTVTVAILAILLSFAAPSFVGVLRENRFSASINEMQSGLQFARSEAVKRRANIMLCRSNEAQTGCAQGEDWTSGWLMMAGNDVLKAWPAVQGMVMKGPVNGLSFLGSGMVDHTASWRISPGVCQPGQDRRVLSLSRTGNVQVTREACS